MDFKISHADADADVDADADAYADAGAEDSFAVVPLPGRVHAGADCNEAGVERIENIGGIFTFFRTIGSRQNIGEHPLQHR